MAINVYQSTVYKLNEKDTIKCKQFADDFLRMLRQVINNTPIQKEAPKVSYEHSLITEYTLVIY